MEGVNPLKESFLLGVLNVGLPTVDVYSDLALTAKFYKSTVTIPEYVIGNQTFPSVTEDVSHPFYASCLLIPCTINYVLGWRAWYYGDVKKSNNNQRRKFTWVFALLGCYPQLVSSRIIYIFRKQPKKALKKKKYLERNVMENEIFTEAVPTTLIMTFLMAVLVVSRDNSFREDDTIHPDPIAILLANERYLTFATSALSAGLGLAKCVKVG